MINLIDVSTAYGAVPVLKRVNISVPDKSITCLLGSNGAGKSTTINTILGFVKPLSGQVLYDDKDITGLSTTRIVRQGIAVVPEGRRVFPKMTVEENLLVGACACRDKSSINTNLSLIFKLFPRLKERKTQNAGTMSGGEQQMLALGRALMSNPEVLLLDEPSLGLAPLVVNEIFSTIKYLNEQQGKTILLIEQNGFKALAIAQRGYLMQKGQIVAACNENTKEAKDELIQAYMAQQNGKGKEN